jgi:hypothetical protein
VCYWLITESGKLISKTSVEHVTRADYLAEDKKCQIDSFNERLNKVLNDENFQFDDHEGLGGIPE